MFVGRCVLDLQTLDALSYNVHLMYRFKIKETYRYY